MKFVKVNEDPLETLDGIFEGENLCVGDIVYSDHSVHRVKYLDSTGKPFMVRLCTVYMKSRYPHGKYVWGENLKCYHTHLADGDAEGGYIALRNNRGRILKIGLVINCSPIWICTGRIPCKVCPRRLMCLRKGWKYED